MAEFSADLEQAICKRFNIPTLKEHQKTIIWNTVVKGKDSLVILPTGMGKSLCFEALTTAQEFMDKGSVRDIVIVVSPLRFLMDMQAEKLNSVNISAITIGEAGSLKDIQGGKYRYIIGNPEEYLCNKEILQLFDDASFKERVLCLVFDGVHTAISWGLSKEGAEAFRKYFSKIGDLRSFFPNVPMMGLTATATKQNQTKIKELLCLRDPLVMSDIPNRGNITMSIEKVKRDVACLEWLVDMLDERGAFCPKTIVYCRSYKDCSEVYRYFLDAFGRNPHELHLRKFDMVHSRTSRTVKNHVEHKIQDSSSMLKVLIATKIIGMGLDLSVDVIVYYGVPCTVEDYLQQIGRAGRRGQHAHAVLLYNGTQLRNVDPQMMSVLKSDKCIRTQVLSSFRDSSEPELTPMSPLHKCCSLCHKLCKCGSCEDNPFRIAKRQAPPVFSPAFERRISSEQLVELKLSLYELKVECDKILSMNTDIYGSPGLLHGLDTSTIKELTDNASTLYSVEDILEKSSVAIYSTACKVVAIFSELFGDMDTDLDVGEDLLY